MSKLDKDTVLDDFTKAYTKANGKAPSIEAKGGWFNVDGGKNIRLAQLDEMATELSAAKPAKKAAVEIASTEKKANVEKKAPAQKKAAATKKKSSSKTFSVKDFYTQQILDANPGAKAPR